MHAMAELSSTRLPWYRALRPRAAAPGDVGHGVHDAVATAIRRQPDRALLVDEKRHLTNAELQDAIDGRARALLARCGAPGATVAVRLDTDVELAITYFACLAAGLRYLPLPASPGAATAGVLGEVAPRLLVTSTRHQPPASAIETLFVDAAQPPPADIPLPTGDPARAAHVLLTSGSATGVPKAVVTDHVGSVLSHAWRARLWPYDPACDVVGCNIFGIWDLVPALLHGVPAVMLADATLRDPFALADAVVRQGITRLMITPTLLDACLACPGAVSALRRLRLIVLCGEAVTAPLLARILECLPDTQCANLYSLSECHDVAAGTLESGRPSNVGHVADFADVHVVEPDDPHALVPVGQAGRILVSGRALAVGYLDPQSTARRFFATAPGHGASPLRVYDTGDLGRLAPDGTLEVLGRIDAGVKVRGAWANPDAVTALLLDHPLVARAVAVARADARGHDRLEAFVVPAAGAPAGLDTILRAELAGRLPPPSVPARIELLEDLPLLASGKIDTAALGGVGGAGPAAAGKSLREQVLAAFREVLEQPDAVAGDAFDTLGGDSLGAIVLCGRIHAATGRAVRVQDLQRHPTAAALAGYLEQHRLRALPDRVPLPMDSLPPAAAPRRARVRTVLLTGATGTLGTTLLQRLIDDPRLQVMVLVRATDDRHARARLVSALPDDTPLARVTALAGDLARPRLGLATQAYQALVERVDAILHLGARLDMFAAYETLAAVNVTGTRGALELALRSGAAFHHVSSSAVLPLGAAEPWDETCYGRALLETLASRLLHSDGYSQSKLAAEALVWQAAERGLRITVTRVPHVVHRHARSRLSETLSALLELGFLPEGPWCWQVATVEAVSGCLVRQLRATRGRAVLRHVAPAPVSDADIAAALQARGHRLRRLTLPALANVIAAAARGPSGSRNLAALDQLGREHGIRTALCLDEPVLRARRPLRADPTSLLVDLLPV